MTASPALPVEKRIQSVNLRFVTPKAVARPWQAALHHLVDHAPAAIAGVAAGGTDILGTYANQGCWVCGGMVSHELPPTNNISCG